MLSNGYKKKLLEIVFDKFMHITRKPTGRHANVEVNQRITHVENQLTQLLDLQKRLVAIRHKHNLICEGRSRTDEDGIYIGVTYTPMDITLRHDELDHIIESLDFTGDLAHILRRGLQELKNDMEK